MSDNFNTTEEQAQSAVSQAADCIRSTHQRVGDAIDKTGLEPGMPLESVATRIREAPLAPLAAAFMMGVLVGRRR
jgi:hypothetical protein